MRIHSDFPVLYNNNLNERKFVTAILQDMRSIMEPRALLQLAFYLINLQGIVALYPQAHLLIVEIVTCDISEKSRKNMV